MAFSALFLENLTELKNRRGNSTNTTIASVLGLNYPTEEALAFYRWFNLATDTPDDDEIVQPTVGGVTTGRWFKIDMQLTFALIVAALGYVPYDENNPEGFISNFIEIDPTVPSYAKTLNAFSIIKVSTDPLYKPIDYAPTSLEVTTALGYTPYNSTNPNSYINQAGARTAISLTTTGTGVSTYNNSTGVLNIPTLTQKRFETFQVTTGEQVQQVRLTQQLLQHQMYNLILLEEM